MSGDCRQFLKIMMIHTSRAHFLWVQKTRCKEDRFFSLCPCLFLVSFCKDSNFIGCKDMFMKNHKLHMTVFQHVGQE